MDNVIPRSHIKLGPRMEIRSYLISLIADVPWWLFLINTPDILSECHFKNSPAAWSLDIALLKDARYGAASCSGQACVLGKSSCRIRRRLSFSVMVINLRQFVITCGQRGRRVNQGVILGVVGARCI